MKRADGVPPVLQPRGVPPGIEGLPGVPAAAGGYRYVLVHLWVITVTRRSVALAISAASLTFVALQARSLACSSEWRRPPALTMRCLRCVMNMPSSAALVSPLEHDKETCGKMGARLLVCTCRRKHMCKMMRTWNPSVPALPRHCHAVLCTAVLPVQQRRPLARTLPVLMAALPGGARAQSASLCLTTTPPEELAGALRTLLAPAGLLGVPVADIGLTLLLSLRFMALVFGEARNLALGLAARGVAWRELGPGGNLQARQPAEPAGCAPGAATGLPHAASPAEWCRIGRAEAQAASSPLCDAYAHVKRRVQAGAFVCGRSPGLQASVDGCLTRVTGHPEFLLGNVLLGERQIAMRLTARLFANLMLRSESIAVAMTARGFAGPAAHKVHPMGDQPSSPVANAAAVALLAGVAAATWQFS